MEDDAADGYPALIAAFKFDKRGQLFIRTAQRYAFHRRGARQH
jgi:hypothetical protein